MSKNELYIPKRDTIDIFKELRKSNVDELLKEGGALDFFYEYSDYPGVTLYLRHKNRIKFFYIDHDNIIMELKDQTPEWEISVDKNLLRISLVYKVNSDTIPIIFLFDLQKKEYRELLVAIRKVKKIKLYYLTILFGGLVLDSMIKFKVPANIIEVLKKIN